MSAATTIESSGDAVLGVEDTARRAQDFNSNPKNLLASNFVSRTDTLQAALHRPQYLKNEDHSYSVQIPNDGKPVTSQSSTGRCWMFAALNCMRIPFATEHKLDSFEFSQAYWFFWDKYERANYFLENIIDTVEEELTGRLVQYILSKPIEDGGQYDMIVNLVEKYGIVPKTCFPEVQATKASIRLNWLINYKLREFAQVLREQAAQTKADKSALRATKKKQMDDIYRILAVHFGVPPTEVNWQARNKDKEFIRVKGLSPLEFYDKYVRKHVDVSNLVSLIHDPRNDVGRLYTVDRLGNVVGGRPVLYGNVPVETLKEHAIAQLKRGEPVWFGCHVSEFFDREKGVMDTEQFDFNLLFDFNMNIDKAGRLSYGESLMTHAMVFTGVDLDDDGKPLKWRVENSWSDTHGQKGYDMMSDKWFDEFNYQIVIDKKYLPKDIASIFDQQPVVLPPWDPMGSLAQ